MRQETRKTSQQYTYIRHQQIAENLKKKKKQTEDLMLEKHAMIEKHSCRVLYT